MFGLLYALITVCAWGTWLAPSQNISFKNQQIKTFYVASANLVLAFLVAWAQGAGRVTAGAFWLPFLGGLIWSVSGLCAFTATQKIGMARAFGVWAPLNILVSLAWGMALFDEFLQTSTLNLVLLGVSVLVIIAGVLMIIFAKGSGKAGQDRKTLLAGFAAAVGAGVLWGTYFIPIKYLGISMGAAAVPLAVGIFSGSVVMAVAAGQSLSLEKVSNYARVILTGVLWAVGNYGMLLLVGQLGAGKGFTISQLSVVVNGLVGVFVLKDPLPKTRAAALTLAGCILATLGGVILGNLK